MSGAHSQHRTANRPLVIDGTPVIKTGKDGRPVKTHTLIPGPVNVDGRPAEYQVFETFATRHVLDYSPAPHWPSKHARGRIRPRTRKEQRRARSLQARFVQLSKRVTVLQTRGAVFDEAQVLAA